MTGTAPPFGIPRSQGSRLRRLAAAMMLTTLAVVPAAPGTAQAPQSGSERPPACETQATSGVPAARLAVLARGFNLTSWLDQSPPRRPDMAALAGLRARGFTHVRLPVTAERLMEAFSTPDAVARQFAELDRAVDSLIELGFGVSIDMHPGGQFGDLYAAEPKRGFELLEALWGRLARRYASRPADRLFFEVLNEPTVDRRTWNVDGPRLVDAIRHEAPVHTIIYGAANYQRIDALIDLTPLADANVVYAVHFYDPMVFTHQGLDWSADDPLSFMQGVPFPAQFSDPAITRLFQTLVMDGRVGAATLLMTQLRQPWTEERIDAEFAHARAWATRHHRSVIVNEFGVLSWKAAPAARIHWLRAVRSAAERHCIGWTHWEYADGFGFVQRRDDGQERPDEAIVRALLDGQS
jgi:endoglucanase